MGREPAAKGILGLSPSHVHSPVLLGPSHWLKCGKMPEDAGGREREIEREREEREIEGGATFEGWFGRFLWDIKPAAIFHLWPSRACVRTKCMGSSGL